MDIRFRRLRPAIYMLDFVITRLLTAIAASAWARAMDNYRGTGISGVASGPVVGLRDRDSSRRQQERRQQRRGTACG